MSMFRRVSPFAATLTLAACASTPTQKAPAAPAVITNKAQEPVMEEFPADTPMVTQTVREALRDAMAEEMRRDGDVFVMGEEVAEYQGAYKITQGLLQEFGAKRVVDTPITEYGFAGVGVGAAFAPAYGLGAQRSVFVQRSFGNSVFVQRGLGGGVDALEVWDELVVD